MKNYPSSTELCEAITFSQVLEVLKLALPERGRFRCPSPDHEDKHPSAKVDRHKGAELFYCHACGAKGNVVNLTMMLRGCSRQDAKDWLRETFLPNWKHEGPIQRPRSFTERDYLCELDRVMTDNPEPREGFKDIYQAMWEWLFVQQAKWMREDHSWEWRIQQVRVWENRLLSLYRNSMKNQVSSAAREKAEKDGWPDGLAEQIEAKMKARRKRYITRGA